jgi:hypothetical protein
VTPIRYIPVRVLAQPKGTLSGGPSGIDFNGPPQDLACEYVMNSPYIDQYFYTSYRSCFEDDTQCINELPAAPSGSEIAMCERECNRPGGMCTTVDLGRSPALSLFAGRVIGGMLPTNQDLQSVSSLLGTAPACAPSAMIIDANGTVISSGSPCSVPIPLSDNAPWEAVVLDVPPTTIGTLIRLPPPQIEASITWRAGATMMTRAYADRISAPVSAPLWALRVRPNELLFATQGSFCARVRFTE